MQVRAVNLASSRAVAIGCLPTPSPDCTTGQQCGDEPGWPNEYGTGARTPSLSAPRGLSNRPDSRRNRPHIAET